MGLGQALTVSGVAAAMVAACLALAVWIQSRKPSIRWRVDADHPLLPDHRLSLDLERLEAVRPFLEAGFYSGKYSSRALDPSVVVLRLRNSGRRPVQKHEWVTPLTFTFPDREVITARIEPAHRRNLSADLYLNLLAGSRVFIRKEILSPNDEVRLVVLLSGRGHGIQADGRLERGRLVQDRLEPLRPRFRLLFAAAEAALVCLAIGLPAAPAFFGKPVQLVHVSGTWGWPVVVALLSLLLGVVGFAVGGALPMVRVARPQATAWSALGRGYLDALAVPWQRLPPPTPTEESAQSDFTSDLLALLTMLGAEDAR